jgi:hypothetical protein
MICPKCGFKQKEGTECPACGIVFSRYHGVSMLTDAAVPFEINSEPAAARISPLRLIFRIFRWAILAVALVAILLILRTPPLPPIVVTPETSARANAKVQEFREALQGGRAPALKLENSELNSWLNSNLALRPTTPPAGSPSATSDAGVPSIEEAQSNVKDVKIELLEDSLRAYVLFDFHGKDLSLQLEGKLLVQNGYIRLIPTGGKLGSLPLLQTTLESATRQLFESPENRGKFRLPPDIRDIRIENGSLVVVSK